MQVELRKPELEQFIADQVRKGRFPSTTAAIEAAVEQMMLDQEIPELDDATIAAINRADEELERGEGMDFNDFAAKMRKKMAAG
jgi:Arc/MetJ-type ribon-helix-helix transcriptional regulator